MIWVALVLAVRSSGFDAVVTIATFNYSAAHVVHSVRSNGRWAGPVYVLSDTEETYPNATCVPITIRRDFPIDKKLASKWFKTQVFVYLPAHINRVLFLDADVAVLKSLQVYGNRVKRRMRSRAYCSAFFFEERWHVRHKYNSGIAVYMRDRSQTLFYYWMAEIESGKHRLDQDALEAIPTQVFASICVLPGSVIFEGSVLSAVTRYAQPRAVFSHATRSKTLAAMGQP